METNSITKQEFIEFLIKQENTFTDCWICVNEDKDNWQQHFPAKDCYVDSINLSIDGLIKGRHHNPIKGVIEFETSYEDFIENYKKTLK